MARFLSFAFPLLDRLEHVRNIPDRYLAHRPARHPGHARSQLPRFAAQFQNRHQCGSVINGGRGLARIEERVHRTLLARFWSTARISKLAAAVPIASWSGHPRLTAPQGRKGVDARAKRGHDVARETHLKRS